MYVQRAAERFLGGDPAAGIETWHAFSFSGFYDPDNVRFGPLAACNEERLAGGAGFPEHPHRDVEIVTWVVEGELAHEDSTGHVETVRPGDVQRLSAGSGVRHSERNAGSAPLRFVQMWLTPSEGDEEPSYEVVRGIADGTPYALTRAEAVLHVRRLRAGERTALPDAPWLYVHVVRGAVRLGGEVLREGDAARVLDAEDLTAEAAGCAAELLAWEMHAEPHFG
ncbi:pirin family protein [Streptomyces triculaminicus]|uniref:Pirin family protein n=2 Tax=Streptomyces TaxID=1883 RepID=A0A939JUJ6_9ACTN|nr:MULTISPECIES: pirin-like bicupin family protein [Streptomyces]MBO0656834.1 pirin family protein [Streptomyces triculaminicus]QSY47740.1 pirin family protein [Streptomyces griseocarneus]